MSGDTTNFGSIKSDKFVQQLQSTTVTVSLGVGTMSLNTQDSLFLITVSSSFNLTTTGTGDPNKSYTIAIENTSIGAITVTFGGAFVNSANMIISSTKKGALTCRYIGTSLVEFGRNVDH